MLAEDLRQPSTARDPADVCIFKEAKERCGNGLAEKPAHKVEVELAEYTLETECVIEFGMEEGMIMPMHGLSMKR